LLDFALNWLQLAESASYELQLFTGLSNEDETDTVGKPESRSYS
jgi:hypothetical protein